MAGLKHCQAFVAIACLNNMISSLSEDVGYHEANKKLVVYDEYGLISHLWPFTQTKPE